MLQTSTANLERVRKMKTRHQRLQTRVTTVREELQSFLEDDDDMMKMCLTHKKEQEQNQAELQRAGGQRQPPPRLKNQLSLAGVGTALLCCASLGQQACMA